MAVKGAAISSQIIFKTIVVKRYVGCPIYAESFHNSVMYKAKAEIQKPLR